MRLRMVGGRLSSDGLRAIAEVADEFGDGSVHITSRQGIEIPHLQESDAEAIRSRLMDAGLEGKGGGPRFRGVMACVGDRICTNGIIDSQDLAVEIDGRHFGEPVPKKFKVAITGCPASCAKPQDNDFGIMGVRFPMVEEGLCTGCGLCESGCKAGAVRVVDGVASIDTGLCVGCGTCVRVCGSGSMTVASEGLRIMVGGKVGRKPRRPDVLDQIVNRERALELLDRVLDIYKTQGITGERLGDLIDRMGWECFRGMMLDQA